MNTRSSTDLNSYRLASLPLSIKLIVVASCLMAMEVERRLLVCYRQERIAIPASSVEEVEAAAFYCSNLPTGSWNWGEEAVPAEVVDFLLTVDLLPTVDFPPMIYLKARTGRR